MNTLIDFIEQHRTDNDEAFFYYLFENDRTINKSYAEIVAESKILAAYLTGRFEFQSRILLIFPPGLDFISSGFVS